MSQQKRKDRPSVDKSNLLLKQIDCYHIHVHVAHSSQIDEIVVYNNNHSAGSQYIKDLYAGLQNMNC